MTSRQRATRALTLGFLTLGAQAAPLDVVAAAAAAGFGSAGLRISGRTPGDAWPSVDGQPEAFAKIKAAAHGAGVRLSNVAGYYMTPTTQAAHLAANVRAAQALGVSLVCQGCFEPDRERLVAMLRDYAAVAADAGVRIALEFMPMSELKTIGQALDAVERAGARNVGLLIDSLHLARSGATAADVAALDPARIYLTQLCDGPATLAPGRTLFDEAMSGRMYVGDGQLDLAGLVRALPADAEIELETPVTADAALSTTERAARAADKARAFFSTHFA